MNITSVFFRRYALPFSLGLSLIAGVAVLPSSVFANAYVNFNTMSYEGFWEKYATLSDAESSQNQVDSGVVPLRDLQVYYSEGYGNDAFQVVTAWNLDGADGTTNPSNQNEGFIQMSDIGSTTVTSANFTYTGADNSGFVLQVSGENALRGEDAQYARAGVGSIVTQGGGNWLSYYFDITYSGLNSSNNSSYILSVDDASGISGTAYILFESTDADDAGFYRIDLTLGDDSWAAANGAEDLTTVIASTVGAIPEPSYFALIAGFTIALLSFARREFKGASRRR
jgi:hypothetical protein